MGEKLSRKDRDEIADRVTEGENYNFMIEDIVVLKRFPGRPNVRLVVDENGNPFIFSTNEKALREAMAAVTDRTRTVKGRKITPPSREHVLSWVKGELPGLP